MQEHDPDHLKTLDAQNPHRLIRALEVKLGTGRSMASFHKQARRVHPFNIIKIGLELPREVLYERIDARMEAMIAHGLFEEARALYPYKDRQALQTVGYREIFDYLDGLYNREEAVRLLKRNTRRYAKRQLTWFKRDESTNWVNNWDELASYLNL
jgi:tRNA dimethylallyltransferase